MDDLQIFLAEDNLGDVLLVREALEKHQIAHQLHTARDGEEALALVGRMGLAGGMPCPDVVLLDLNLPKVDGPEVLAEFRKHSQCSTTPVIAITSSDASKDRARMAALGVAYYFRKPANLDEFMELGAVVLKVMNAKGSAGKPLP